MTSHALEDIAQLTVRAAGAGACAIVMRMGHATSFAASVNVTREAIEAASHLIEAVEAGYNPLVIREVKDPQLQAEGFEVFAMASAPISTVSPSDGGSLVAMIALYRKNATVPEGLQDTLRAGARQAARQAALPSSRFAVAPANYARLAELTDVLLCVAGLDGYLLQLNDAWSEVLGWSAEELTSRPYLSFVHPDDIQRTIDEAAALTSEKDVAVNFQNRYQCRDGSYRWLNWHSRVSRAENVVYCAVVDITESKALEARLRESREMLEKTARIARVGGWELNLQEEGPRWSEEVYRIHEVDRDYVPKLDEAIKFYPPEVRETVTSAVERAIATGVGWDLELPFVTAKGRQIQVRAAGEPVYDDAGTCVALRGIFQDITDRYQAERAKRDFLSTVSHELRTPLTSIGGSLRLLEAGVVGELPDTALEMVSIASRNVDRLVRLINDILDLDKLESDLQELSPQATDLGQLVREATDDVRGLAAEVGISLHVTGGAPSANVDPDRITQVLTNLITNAVKFAPEGSNIRVGIEPADNDRVRIFVTDEGPGIPESDRSAVFERFHQLDGSDARQVGGTGLGLAICKAIVEQHRGTIGVDSTVGEGSTFWFELDLLL